MSKLQAPKNLTRTLPLKEHFPDMLLQMPKYCTFESTYWNEFDRDLNACIHKELM